MLKAVFPVDTHTAVWQTNLRVAAARSCRSSIGCVIIYNLPHEVFTHVCFFLLSIGNDFVWQESSTVKLCLPVSSTIVNSAIKWEHQVRWWGRDLVSFPQIPALQKTIQELSWLQNAWLHAFVLMQIVRKILFRNPDLDFNLYGRLRLQDYNLTEVTINLWVVGYGNCTVQVFPVFSIFCSTNIITWTKLPHFTFHRAQATVNGVAPIQTGGSVVKDLAQGIQSPQKNLYIYTYGI